MREILFRGKRIDNGEWVYGHYGEYTNMRSETISAMSVPNKNSIYGNLCYDVDSSTVGQYTGLTDKNGKKIFEGDILKIYEGSENDGYKICEVYSYGGVLCVDYETSEWDFNALAFLDSDNVFTFEVIGNVHDNPELLGGDKK